MKWLFWLSFALIVYAYAGYPLWVYLRSRRCSSPVRCSPIVPSVSIIMAVRNEASVLPRKLRNLVELDYPSDLYELIVVSDGSTDATNTILAAFAHPRLRVIALPQQGKACALNAGIEAAKGEILVFTDARQRLAADAVRRLAANFADPLVGCVSGELLLERAAGAGPVDGVGLYWQIEKKLRQWEGAGGSAIGATGALYAVRRNLIVPLPAGTILDDVYIPMHVARQGARVVFEPKAQVWDHLSSRPEQEFRRKVRTLTGNYQLLQLAPWLLTRANPLRFEFISHKLLRLAVPFALLITLVSSLLAHGWGYQLAAVAQLAFYGMAALAMLGTSFGLLDRVAKLAMTFVMLNTAAVAALISFVFGRKQLWVR